MAATVAPVVPEPVHRWGPGPTDQAHDNALFSVTNACANLEVLAGYERSRALSLAITKAQECAMWLAWHDSEMGRGVSVFPSPGHDSELEDSDFYDQEELPFIFGFGSYASVGLPPLPPGVLAGEGVATPIPPPRNIATPVAAPLADVGVPTPLPPLPVNTLALREAMAINDDAIEPAH